MQSSIEENEAKWKELIRSYWLVTSAYVVITLITIPFFMADTIGYADLIVRRDFLDFGHYGWYLAGWLAAQLMTPITRLFVGESAMLNVTLTLVIVSWLAGLMSALLMRSLAFHITRREWAANVATLALTVSLAFLNFSQTGCSYIPGMSLLLLGIHILVKHSDEPRRAKRYAICAGFALAGAIAMWFTYVFAVPAAIAAPLILRGYNKQRFISAVQTAATISLITVVLFGAGAYSRGLRSAGDFKQWVAQSAHGAHGMNGVARAAFGAGHSFIDMGNDGPMVKAYLVSDPYNPVSLAELLRTSLWKLALFYLFLGAVAFNLLRAPQGRRVFALLAATAAPVGAFAILWQGGAIERYLLLCPVVFLALSYSLANERSNRSLRYLSYTFVVAMTISNLVVMAKPVQNRREQAAVARLMELRSRLKRDSLVVTLNQSDDVWALQWTFPFNPINASETLNAYDLVAPLTDQVLSWREKFSEEMLSRWDKGGDAWLSARLLGARPLREWNWVEGSDPNVSWQEINEFFTRLELGETVGGEDGFRLLVPSGRNRSLLTSVAQQKTNLPAALASMSVSQQASK